MTNSSFTAFAGTNFLASGDLRSVLLAAIEHGPESTLLFEDETGRQRDFDFSGTPAEILARAIEPPKAGPGRPKLGVVSREVSLLPRHWDWLEDQPNGASAALRRLVEEARLRDGGVTEKRLRIEALGRIMTAVAGNLPGFEEATRHLYAQKPDELRHSIAAWPEGIRNYLERRLAVISGVA